MSPWGSHTVRVERDMIHTDAGSFRVSFSVADVRIVDEVIVVLYRHDAGPRHHQFRNLEAFDLTGHKLWTAEQPTSETADAYVALLPGPSLAAVSFAGYRCELDPRTGRLLSTEFVK